jgi:hypothetical protein
MAAIYSNGGNRWNILGFNFTKRDALSIVYIIYLWLSHSLQTAIFLRSVRSSLTDLKNMTLDFASAFLSQGKYTTLDSKTRL